MYDTKIKKIKQTLKNMKWYAKKYKPQNIFILPIIPVTNGNWREKTVNLSA